MVDYPYSKIIFVLVFVIFFIWLIIYQLPDNKLHIVNCDVGQGDGAVIIYKSFQILIDGGPANGKVENCLGKFLPFWDKHLEIVVNSHPQLDHFGGLIKVFEDYKVDKFIFTDEGIITPELNLLKKVVGSNGATVINPVIGMSIEYNLISYDIFWPSENLKPIDLNDISNQGKLKYKNFEAIFTGDIGITYSEEILQNLQLDSLDYIKIPHHGSKNSMAFDYLRKFMPKVAVISVGKNNSFGHPSPEVIKMLRDKGVKILRTDESGDIEIITDGDKIWVKN